MCVPSAVVGCCCGAVVTTAVVAVAAQLDRLGRLNHAAAVELLKELCVELEMSDATALAPAVRKLKRVVVAVPPLEDFTRRVCDIVSSHGGGGGGGGGSSGGLDGGYLERCIGVVLQWAHASAEAGLHGVGPTFGSRP